MTLENLIHEAERLPAADRWRLVRHLLNTLESTTPTPQEDWHSFVNRMYGALADDPLERPSDLPWTEREPID
jgi:hypothetical protein